MILLLEKGPIKCCTIDGKLLPDFQRHSSCMPISVPKYDPIYGQDNREYLPFVRTVTGINGDGSLRPGEQVIHTKYIYYHVAIIK